MSAIWKLSVCICRNFLESDRLSDQEKSDIIKNLKQYFRDIDDFEKYFVNVKVGGKLS